MKTRSKTKPADRQRSAWRDSDLHRLLGLKSARQAEQVLAHFESEHPKDHRPRRAIQAIRSWAQGKLTLGMARVRKLALDSHAAARQARTDAAKYAARAAGQAVAVWHAPTHAMAVPIYVCKAQYAAPKIRKRKTVR